MATTPETSETSATPAAPVTATPPSAGPRWLGWLANFALGGSILAVVIALGSLTLARYDIIGKLPGFIGFMMLLNPARALALAALVALVVALVRKAGPRAKALLALVLSGGLLLAMYTQVILPAGKVPPLHDITTNVDSPPQFATLELRADNLVPFQSEEEWRAAHRQGYPDIAPVLIDKSPDEVLAAARALAESKGWTVASVDPQTGQLEATAYAGYLRFMDDVIVKVSAVEDGSTRVDMRSVSRVGVSDLGYNAQRIREFLAELQAS